MAILAIAIVMIGLGAVSAVDDTSFNQTAITANEDSQDLNLADVNNGDADDIGSQEQNNVGVANENDVLEAADDEDVLGADTTLEIINEKTSYTQNDQITVKMGSYSMASDSSDVDVYLNNDKIATTTYGEVHSSTGFTFSLSNAIIGENTVYCSGSSMFGSYTSDSVTFTVTEGSQSGNSSGGDESGIVLKVTDAYSKYDGQSSSLHFPYTEDYVFIATTGNNARYNAVVTFSVEGASSSAKIKLGSTEQSISSGTATLEFNTDNLGENTIYVVDGSEKSNEVKVYVVSGQNKIASLSVDPEWGVEGQNITITPTAMSSGSSSADGYTSRPISGYVTFYSSSSYTDENRIATVSTDGGSFTVPLVDINAECDYIQLYYTFAGEYNNKGFIHSGSKYVYFLVLDSNPIALTGNGQTGEINLGSDKKINLHVAPTYYMNDGTNSFIDVYVGTDKVGTFSAASTTSVEDFELDLTGYSAGDYDVYVKYEGYNFEDTNQDVYYHAGNESNHLTVHIEDSAPKTLKIDIDAVDYPNEVMAVVTASQTGTYTITIGTKTINVEIGEDDLNGKSVSLGQFDAGDDYTATIVSDDDSTLSNSTPFVVNKGTLTLNVEAVGNNTVYGEGSKTLTASAGDVTSGKVQYFENGVQIGEDSSLGISFDVSSLGVGTHTITVRYIDNNYQAEDQTVIFNIKDILTITLTRNGENVVIKPGDSVYFTITYSEAVSDNLELWINDYKLNDEDGGSSISITFDASDVGENNVFIKFLGNDNYGACVSNNVTVKVVEPVETTTTLEINTTDILSGGKILITPNVVDSNGNAVTVGTVTIGKDLYGYNDIVRINAGETYEYTVDSNDFNPYNNPYFLYARYSGATDVETIYKASQTASGTRYYHIYSNTLTLTVNGESEITAYVGSEVTFLATVGNGEGRIVIVDKDGVETEITGETPIKFDAIGDFTYYAKFTRADNSYYASVESSPVTVHVIEKETNEITVSVESITLPGDVTVQVTATKAGNYTVKINDTASTEVKVEVKADGETGSASITLPKGNYSAVVDYSSDIYNVIIHNTTFEVVSISAGFNATATPSEVEEGDTVKINTSVKIMGATGEVTIILPNGSEIKVALGEEVSYDASEVGEKTFIIMFDSSNGYLSESVTLTVKVNEKKPIDLTDDVLNITVPTDGSNPVFSVDLPTKENGTLSVTVNNKTYNATVLNGNGSVEVSGLDVGEYNATVVFVDNKNNLRANKTVGFTVPKEDVPADKAFNITSPSDSTSPTFSMDLPGATGNFTVVIGNNTYTKELVDGKATITVDDLNPGEYNATVSYSGDAKHSPISQNTTVNIPTPELSNNKNINVVYSAKATYKVRVTVNGKAVVGQNVTIKYNGKTYNVKTDKNGYATLNLKTNVKVKAYTITATFKGVKVSNKVTVKHMIKAKNLKIKKSKKVVKVKVKTSKVNGKFLKGKKLKLKLKGKTLKAKINKKGVATFKVKKNILKKLKVGKKYTYKVSYGKDIVSKKIKVKR